MEPKQPRGKALIVVIVILIILAGIGFYYTTAILNSSNRPAEVERES